MTENDKSYTFEDLAKLKNDIEKIKNKKFLTEIKNIIVSLNPDISITRNENGLYMHFHNLTPETYHSIKTYIKKYKNNNTINKIESDSSDCFTYSTVEYPFEGNSKLKYSNKEKNLIKRKQYDKELKTQNLEASIDSINEPSDSVFIKTKK